MPTLYTQADSNIRKTWFLLLFFLLFIIGLGWFFSYVLGDNSFLIIVSFVAIFQALVGLFYSDKIILSMTNAKEIKKEDNPELYRIVENLCITAGLPMPKIYIANEEQPNAFTTGRNKKDAVIVVNRGLLEKLDRRELEGVIAHELSHIGNRDVFLASIVVILVSIVSIISNLFMRFLYLGNRRNKRNNSNGIFVLLGFVGVLLAPLVAILIRMAISRKREFLADANGVLLTRDPQGLANALRKISLDGTKIKKLNNSIAHLYFSSPFRENSFSKLFMTHPPVQERINILERM